MVLKGGSGASKQIREAPSAEAKAEAERIAEDSAKTLLPLLKKMIPPVFNRPGGR